MRALLSDERARALISSGSNRQDSDQDFNSACRGAPIRVNQSLCARAHGLSQSRSVQQSVEDARDLAGGFPFREWSELNDRLGLNKSADNLKEVFGMCAGYDASTGGRGLENIMSAGGSDAASNKDNRSQRK